VHHDLVSLLNQKLGGHLSEAVCGAGYEDARHSEILFFAIVRKLGFKKGLFGTVMAVSIGGTARDLHRLGLQRD
jgi:hypothetical protein